jgi:hypothetical protein
METALLEDMTVFQLIKNIPILRPQRSTDPVLSQLNPAYTLPSVLTFACHLM